MSLYCVNWESVAKTDGIVRHPYLEYKENVTKISNFFEIQAVLFIRMYISHSSASKSLCIFLQTAGLWGSFAQGGQAQSTVL